ncbi:conserved hypothetical protein [Aspergillus fumigatus A1163]|uniref:Ataxin-2 C-terminal domain-containing protein n=1 Tax=Aspergillus fumigatus (strain CBS 144.89 / FGSC A1163 / CEA10) TaxID=451804 RepID=B0Y5N9_ASPFC|nr:conserved hypothetical protein [Aspergillus fumigatus A1163]
MDEEAIERLKRLQMEDLGTLRREYISTVDTKKFRNIRLEDIEATRMINVAGSDAAHLAQVNQARLNAWANAYKDLCDPADQEPLDHLLNGQSHRLGLRAVIEGSGGQSYSKSSKKNDSSPQVAGHALSGRSASTRVSKPTSRGGGGIGTKGRETKQTSPNAQTRVTHQGAVAKLGNHVVQSPHARKHLQDPALDINNQPPKKSRDQSGSKLQTVVKSGKYKPLSSITGAVNHETPQSFNQPEETNAGRAYKDSTVSFRSDGDSVAIATPVSSNNGQSSRVSIVQAAHTATETDQRFEPSRLRSSQQGKPQHVKSNSELADDKAQAGKQNQDDALVDVSTPPSGSTTIVRSKDLYYDNVQTEGKTGILLDFNSTPPRKSLPGAENSLSMSPALQDLEGINFQVNVAQSILLRPEQRPETQIYSFIEADPVDLKDFSSPRIVESNGDTMTPTPDSTPSDLAALREKLARLCKFVEETLRHHVPEPLRDMDLQALRKYEQELTEILSLHQGTMQETASQTARKRQEFLSSRKSQEKKAETAVERKSPKISSPTPSVCSPPVKAPLEEGNSKLSLCSEEAPSPSKFNVQAKKFVPTVAARNPSFSGWRDTKLSPPSSTTSESRTGRSQHSRQNSQDYMLIESTTSLSSRFTSQLPPCGGQASENHIFGDHLLPGRGRINEPNDACPKFLTPTMPQALSVPRARPSVPERIITHGASNSESAESTSASCSIGEPSPRPARLATTAPATGSNGVKSDSNSGPSTPTSVPKAAKAVYKAIPKVSAISQVNALQRSMHAPKVQENPTAMRNPSTLALGGLGGSIYATPVVQKPTVAAPENRRSTGLHGSRWASSETQKPLR